MSDNELKKLFGEVGFYLLGNKFDTLKPAIDEYPLSAKKITPDKIGIYSSDKTVRKEGIKILQDSYPEIEFVEMESK